MLLCREQIDLVTCAAEEQTRYALKGIRVEAENACTSKVTATDGRRLAQVTCENGGIAGSWRSDGIPRRFANPDSNGSFSPCTIDAETVKGIRKAWPKAKRDQDLMIGLLKVAGAISDKVRLEFGDGNMTAMVIKAESTLDGKAFRGILMPISTPAEE